MQSGNVGGSSRDKWDRAASRMLTLPQNVVRGSRPFGGQLDYEPQIRALIVPKGSQKGRQARKVRTDSVAGCAVARSELVAILSSYEQSALSPGLDRANLSCEGADIGTFAHG